VRKTELLRGDQVVARAATTWAFMSLASGRPQRIPEQLLAAFQ
jgi:acyl-CoA thioesterase FadM